MSFAPPERCNKTWIQTATGRQFWPLNPRQEDVSIEDIAHHLANKCRFTGATAELYSVAQHSVLMAEFAIENHGRSTALYALLHDAAEAYVPDVARPVKPYWKEFREIEERLMSAIMKALEIPWPMMGFVEETIKHLDLMMLATERRDLMPTPPIPWLSTENVTPLRDEIDYWTRRVAKQEFLRMYHKLTQGE
jgi:uncharacterized protein